ALLGQEAVEQQLVLGRIDRGDAEAEAHRRVGRRAAPLAQDRRLAAAGEVDDLLDGQEIGRDAELADQRQLFLERFPNIFLYPIGITPFSAFPCPQLEVRL